MVAVCIPNVSGASATLANEPLFYDAWLRRPSVLSPWRDRTPEPFITSGEVMAGCPEGLSVTLEPSCLDDPDPFRSLLFYDAWLRRPSVLSP